MLASNQHKLRQFSIHLNCNKEHPLKLHCCASVYLYRKHLYDNNKLFIKFVDFSVCMSNCQNKISLFDFLFDCDETSSPAASTLIAIFWSFHISIAYIPFQKRIFLSPLIPVIEKKYYLISFHSISFSFQFLFSSWLHFSLKMCFFLDVVYRMPTPFTVLSR